MLGFHPLIDEPLAAVPAPASSAPSYGTTASTGAVLGATELGAMRRTAGGGATSYKNGQIAGSVAVTASGSVGKISGGVISASISVTSSNIFGKDVFITPSAAATSVTVAAVVQKIVHFSAIPPSNPLLYYYCANHSNMGNATNQATRTTQNYTVTVYGGKFYINGVQNPVISLEPGAGYTFDQSHISNTNHPLRLSETSNGTHGGGVEYTNSVVVTGTPGSAGAKTVITVWSFAQTMPFITATPVDASVTRFPVVGTAIVAATASTPTIRPQRFMAASASTAITATGAAGKLQKAIATASAAVTATASATIELLMDGSAAFAVAATAAPRAIFSAAASAATSTTVPAVNGLRIRTIAPPGALSSVAATAEAQRVRSVAATANIAITAQAAISLAPPLAITASAQISITSQASLKKIVTISVTPATLSSGATAAAQAIKVDLMAATAAASVSASANNLAIRHGSVVAGINATATVLPRARLSGLATPNVSLTVAAVASNATFHTTAAANIAVNHAVRARLDGEAWDDIIVSDAVDPWSIISTTANEPVNPWSIISTTANEPVNPWTII